jgi:hypothetical protein
MTIRPRGGRVAVLSPPREGALLERPELPGWSSKVGPAALTSPAWRKRSARAVSWQPRSRSERSSFGASMTAPAIFQIDDYADFVGAQTDSVLR